MAFVTLILELLALGGYVGDDKLFMALFWSSGQYSHVTLILPVLFWINIFVLLVALYDVSMVKEVKAKLSKKEEDIKLIEELIVDKCVVHSLTQTYPNISKALWAGELRNYLGSEIPEGLTQLIFRFELEELELKQLKERIQNANTSAWLLIFKRLF